MPTVTVGSAQVSFQVEPGPGTPVVLVHGTAGSAQSNFGHLTGQWGDRTVVGLDLSGSGDTVDGGGAIELDDLVAQVTAVAREATSAAAASGAGTGSDERGYHLVGYSLGAVVATAVAARDAAAVRSLTAIAGWVSSDDGRTQVQFRLWQDLIGQRPDLAAPFLLLTGFSPRFLAALTAEQAQLMAAGMREGLAPGAVRQAELDTRIDIRQLAAEVSVPTLVVGLSQDQMVPVDHARALHRLIPGARYAEIDTGHLVMFEDPATLTQTITGFLDDVDGGPGVDVGSTTEPAQGPA
jgi:3-oxoadipate enol-lactonase